MPTETTDQAAQTPIESEASANVNNNEPSTTPAPVNPSTSQAPETQADDTNESQDASELKEQETASNDGTADNTDVIDVYSSGDEGKQIRIPCNYRKIFGKLRKNILK